MHKAHVQHRHLTGAQSHIFTGTYAVNSTHLLERLHALQAPAKTIKAVECVVGRHRIADRVFRFRLAAEKSERFDAVAWCVNYCIRKIWTAVEGVAKRLELLHSINPRLWTCRVLPVGPHST